MTPTTEYLECRIFYEWTQWHPKLKGLVKHCPNEGLRTPQTGARLKAIGMSKGFPDFFIYRLNRKFGGLALEMKLPDWTGKPRSKEQDEWLERLNKQGYYATYAKGWIEAKEITEAYLDERL